MSPIVLSAQELAYVLLALKRYENELLSREEEDDGDVINDLIFVQALQKKLEDAKR
jgi:hypothetical protein